MSGSTGIDGSIEEYEPGMGSGPVLVEFMSHKGYICAENFDDKDATVICKQKGFAGGYAYRFVLTLSVFKKNNNCNCLTL